METVNISREAQVRRTDLNFRAEFIDIPTVIYQIEKDDYIIWADIDETVFGEVEEKFDRGIRPMTLRVKLSVTKPLKYIKTIPGIADDEIPKNFEGMFMSSVNLYNLLLAKFPHINIFKLESQDFALQVHVYNPLEKTEMGTVRKYVSNAEKEALLTFLSGLGMGIKCEIIETNVEAIPELDKSLQYNPIQYINAPKLAMLKVPKYIQRDEALWYDNTDNMFNGKFGKKDLYFFDNNDYCCYIDYTGGKHIDIRNFLLLYNTIFITPPFETDLRIWVHEQNLTLDDFFYLIQKGRIKIILSQYEQRYFDGGLFNEIFAINEQAIISRRGVTTLQQIDINEIADNYFFSKIKNFDLLKQIAELAAKNSGVEASFIYETLIWPMKAKRQSFEALQWAGCHGVMGIGVNKFASKIVNKRFGKDLDLEFMISANTIHLAHALNATYFPFKNAHGFSDDFYAHLMGYFLNIFKNTTPDNISSLEKITDFNTQLNPIHVWEMNTYVDINEFEDVLSEAGGFKRGKQLMEQLALLSPEARSMKIAAYNAEIKKRTAKKSELKRASIDLGVDLAIEGVGAVSQLAGLGPAISVLKFGGKQLSKLEEVKKLNEKIEEIIYSSTDKKNIHFLSKINRVARLKR